MFELWCLPLMTSVSEGGDIGVFLTLLRLRLPTYFLWHSFFLDAYLCAVHLVINFNTEGCNTSMYNIVPHSLLFFSFIIISSGLLFLKYCLVIVYMIDPAVRDTRKM